MSRSIILLILLSSFVTYVPRLLPILVLKNATLPEWFQRWMAYLPIAIFASLLATDIFYWEDQLSFDIGSNLKLIPSILTLFVAYKTKNMIYSILAGVGAITLFTWFM